MKVLFWRYLQLNSIHKWPLMHLMYFSDFKSLIIRSKRFQLLLVILSSHEALLTIRTDKKGDWRMNNYLQENQYYFKPKMMYKVTMTTNIAREIKQGFDNLLLACAREEAFSSSSIPLAAFAFVSIAFISISLISVC